MLIPYAATVLISAVVAYITVRLLIPVLSRRGVLDIPNTRSSHSIPVPRGGGFGMLAGLAAGFAIAFLTGAGVPHWTILVATAGIALTGALDDLAGGIHPGIRLSVQTLLALLVVWGTNGLSALPLPTRVELDPLAGTAVALVWIVGVTNVFNFLDGIDGFAGTQALVAGVALASVSSDTAISAAALALAASAAGFLVHNWHPARIFMGDAGSTTTGFLLAALPFHAPSDNRPQLIFCTALFLWFFLSDGLWTLLRRMARGETFWKPHRSHLYQQLARAGVRHDTITASVMFATAVLSAMAVASARWNASLSWAVLGTALVLFVAYAATVRRVKATHEITQVAERKLSNTCTGRP